MRRVLDQMQSVPVRDRFERAHVAHKTIKMNWQNRLRPRRDCGFHPGGIEIAGVGFDVDENGCGARLQNRGGGGNEAHRRSDHFVA